MSTTGQSSFRGFAPTVGITRRTQPPVNGEDKRTQLEQQARELLVGRIVEQVEITEKQVVITASGGAKLTLDFVLK